MNYLKRANDFFTRSSSLRLRLSVFYRSWTALGIVDLALAEHPPENCYCSTNVTQNTEGSVCRSCRLIETASIVRPTTVERNV